ncbi:MAG: glycosyltransferase family 39 protein, partial [Candidatus Sungbacteria bacterium]|nr:glycosyltransferase family 39 protein [Candidatus Sungbacteria bacterium]
GNNALEAIATHHFKVFYPENNGREGFFINMQALSVWAFGPYPWALRGVSALVGTLTIIGIFLVTKEIFSHRGNKRKQSAATTIALLAAFFLATSYWHLNFSRIGFRAIMVPMVSTFALYFLLKGLRTKSILSLILAGIFTGIGYQTYIAFRFFTFVLAIPLVAELISYFRNYRISENPKKSWRIPCGPCAVVLFLFITFVTALPLGMYFLHNIPDFIGRGNQVSIFAAASPLKEFVTSNIKTLGMFFVSGDCNWRHNYNCMPSLAFPLALFFTFGIFVTLRDCFKRTYVSTSVPFILLVWLVLMSLPATLTWEGMPHALRTIGMIPPVMILTAFGTWRIIRAILDYFERRKSLFPEKIQQINRIQQEIKLLFMIAILFIPIFTFRTYFSSWAQNPNTYFALSTDLMHLGEFLRDRPSDTTAYVVVNLSGTEVRDIPMPAQTVMFITDTFRQASREAKKIFYVRTDQLDTIRFLPEQKIIVALLDGNDKTTLDFLQKKFPDMKPKAPGDFVILENYY